MKIEAGDVKNNPLDKKSKQNSSFVNFVSGDKDVQAAVDGADHVISQQI